MLSPVNHSPQKPTRSPLRIPADNHAIILSTISPFISSVCQSCINFSRAAIQKLIWEGKKKKKKKGHFYDPSTVDPSEIAVTRFDIASAVLIPNNTLLHCNLIGLDLTPPFPPP
jgi:hypothetical protein